jgi:pimeloyl-ACP methyl ester carboxylesterase
MIVYFLSGLGADERAFQKIILPPEYEIRHIPWELIKGDETLEYYAQKLSLKIDDTQPFLLAGLSMGGIVALEICKF